MKASTKAGPKQGKTTESFNGFALPTSNTTYTPNQFFDVCLPNYSRGCVRFVAVMIRKTLGWSDSQGRPQHEQIMLRYSDFETAGISREMIRKAAAEAIKGRFIRCVRLPLSKGRGQAASSGLYELNWDESGEYIKDPKKFRGFFAGDGNRTYIPNQFFDHLIVREPLATVKVVGSVIRFSIGFANKWGHRRMQVSLSYLDIQRYSHLRDRKTLAASLRYALSSNYLQRVEEGYFDPNGGVRSRAATYAVRWLNHAETSSIGQKTPSAENAVKDRSENTTGIGQKTLPGDRSENPTGLEITNTNNNLKQQRAGVAASLEKKENGQEESRAAAVEKLRKEGFDRATADNLAAKYSIQRILRQIDWIGQRGAKRNRLGMLRVAIERDWPKPEATGLGRPNLPNRQQDELAEASRRLSERFNPFTP